MNRRTARLAILVLTVAACVNLAAGATIALRDRTRQSDLFIVHDWCSRWLAAGEGLYTAPSSVTDYPPNAIVMLSPMALLPRPWLVPLWTALGLVLAPVLAALVIGCVRRGDWSVAAVPMLLFLCWQSTRTLLQFTALSMTLAFLSVRLVDSHRLASGVALGLALFKPHIAGPIALWAVLTGRARVVMVAAAVALAGWAAYDARIGESPITTLDGYLGVLGRLHAGPHGLFGRTSVRIWTRMISADPHIASDPWWIAVSALLLAGVWWLARRDPQRPVEAGGLGVIGLLCVWSLLTFYHNSNNLIMMLPAFVFLWFLDDSDDRAASWRRWVPIVSLQAALMFDVPTRLGPRMSHETWVKVAVDDFDRLVVLASFAYVALRWYRLTRPLPGPRSYEGHEGSRRRTGLL